MSFIVGLIVVSLLIVANGFFVAVEFSLVASNRSKLETLAKQGSWPARAALATMKRLSFHLSGAQLGITVTSLVLGYLIAPVVSVLVDPLVGVFGISAGTSVSIVFALVFATVIQMVIGELIPKNIAIARPEQTAQLLSPAARVVHGALKPLIVAFNGTANWTVRRFGMEPKEELEGSHSIDDLEYMIDTSATSGELTPEALQLLHRTFRFGEKTVADALTPRVHVRAVSMDATVLEFADEAKQSRHSRYPVMGFDVDDIRGYVSVLSIFEVPVQRRGETEIADLMKPPLVVPETKFLVDVLDDFQADPSRLGVVVDEHGGTAGILTLEDVLEEIVGEVDDEFDETPEVSVGAAGVFVVAGTSQPDEVSEAVGLPIPEGEYETVAGFVLDRLGHVPTAGDSFEFQGWNIEVVEMDKLRIASLQFVELGEGS